MFKTDNFGLYQTLSSHPEITRTESDYNLTKKFLNDMVEEKDKFAFFRIIFEHIKLTEDLSESNYYGIVQDGADVIVPFDSFPVELKSILVRFRDICTSKNNDNVLTHMPTHN